MKAALLVGLRRPTDVLLGWGLVVLIIGCVVVYGVRVEAADGRSAEPGRPF
jgi:hypothetical protein